MLRLTQKGLLKRRANENYIVVCHVVRGETFANIQTRVYKFIIVHFIHLFLLWINIITLYSTKYLYFFLQNLFHCCSHFRLFVVSFSKFFLSHFVSFIHFVHIFVCHVCLLEMFVISLW